MTVKLANTRHLAAGKWVKSGSNPVTPPPVTPPPTGETILLETDWEFAPTGPLNTTAGLANFRTGLGDSNVAGTSNLANASIINDATEGHAYRQSFAAGVGDGLAVFADGPFAGLQLTQCRFELRLRFTGGFGWGCKIPGPGGVNAAAAGPSEVTGGKTPTSTNGVSARHMMLNPESGETKTRPDFANYVYHAGQGDIYGDDELFGRGPVLNQWHSLIFDGTMNTFNADGTPKTDGKLLSWWDGVSIPDMAGAVPGHQRNAYTWRAKDDIFWTHIYWSLFWGGANKAQWAPAVASSIDISYMKISTRQAI